MGYQDGQTPIPPPADVMENVRLAETQSAEERANLDVYQEIEEAIGIQPETEREKILHNGLVKARNNALESNVREILTAKRANKLEESQAARKDGTRRRLKLGGRVCSSNSVRAELKEKDDAAKAKAAKKGSRKRAAGRRAQAAEEAEEWEDAGRGASGEVEGDGADLGEDPPPSPTSCVPKPVRRPRPRPQPRVPGRAPTHDLAQVQTNKETLLEPERATHWRGLGRGRRGTQARKEVEMQEDPVVERVPIRTRSGRTATAFR